MSESSIPANGPGPDAGQLDDLHALQRSHDTSPSDRSGRSTPHPIRDVDVSSNVADPPGRRVANASSLDVHTTIHQVAPAAANSAGSRAGRRGREHLERGIVATDRVAHRRGSRPATGRTAADGSLGIAYTPSYRAARRNAPRARRATSPRPRSGRAAAARGRGRNGARVHVEVLAVEVDRRAAPQRGQHVERLVEARRARSRSAAGFAEGRVLDVGREPEPDAEHDAAAREAIEARDLARDLLHAPARQRRHQRPKRMRSVASAIADERDGRRRQSAASSADVVPDEEAVPPAGLGARPRARAITRTSANSPKMGMSSAKRTARTLRPRPGAEAGVRSAVPTPIPQCEDRGAAAGSGSSAAGRRVDRRPRCGARSRATSRSCVRARVPLVSFADLGFHELGHLIMYVLPINQILTRRDGFDHAVRGAARTRGLLRLVPPRLARDGCVPRVGRDELPGRERLHRGRALPTARAHRRRARLGVRARQRGARPPAPGREHRVDGARHRVC